jgi:hypothetical protein
MVRLAGGVELPHAMPTDRLHHAYAREDHWATVLGRLDHHARGGLHLRHGGFGLRDFFRQPSDGLLKCSQLSTIRQFNRFLEATGPRHQR